ncbi:myosin heavy chain kinase B-like [Dorcoceras hygrometricum]|uniref:Myosin heavy chain kinase B-like n=1 Tax=Dorcoceras hygrometricum TaxID=472368 RepID=A0A2Z7D1W0_9LAMI|nr:myosin heavy chain kinase B-like [Dorcoceras hygrometricum]
MESRYSRRSTTLSNHFTDVEEEHSMHSPPRLSADSRPQDYDHRHDNLLFSPSRSPPHATNMYSVLPPPSPESPWTLSPHQTPSPSLLYHCIATLHRQEGAIFSIAAARGLVFTGSESRRIRAWRQPDCTERGYLEASYGEIRAILAHGNTLFTSHKDDRIRVWNASSVSEDFQAKKITTLPKRGLFLFFSKSKNNKHKDRISCMAYNHGEGVLYTGSLDRTIKAWRVSDNLCVDSFTAHEDCINAIVVKQDDGCVFSSSSDGSVKIWRRVYGQSSHSLTMTLKFQPSPINALALSISPSSCFLYSGSSDGFINFWEKEKTSGRFNHGGFLQGHRFSVLCLVAKEKLVFSGSEDTTIRVWRREEGSCFHECLAVLDAHRGPVKCLAVSLEIEKVMVMGFLLYSAGLDQAFKVWRIKILPEEKESTQDLLVEPKNVVDSFETNPVLSPSWVMEKLQGNHPFR